MYGVWVKGAVTFNLRVSLFLSLSLSTVQSLESSATGRIIRTVHTFVASILFCKCEFVRHSLPVSAAIIMASKHKLNVYIKSKTWCVEKTGQRRKWYLNSNRIWLLQNTISDWKKNQAKIEQSYSSASENLSIMGVLIWKIRQSTFLWFTQEKQKGIPITVVPLIRENHFN